MWQDVLTEKKKQTEDILQTVLQTEETDLSILYESMNYSLLAGGKRIRPILFLLVLDVLGAKPQGAMTVAAAIECVHTYSLIHDDLPQMDDDAYRRGRLTNHKVYGAGMATMAGDGLLTEAIHLIAAEETIPAEQRCKLISVLTKAAGPLGMVGGQALDISAEGKALTAAELLRMDEKKTGALLTAPVDMASILGDADEETRAALHQYARHLGLLFQITDDLLDETGNLEEMGKEPGMDAKMHKSTYVTILGKEKAEEAAKKEMADALDALACLGEKAGILKSLTQYVWQRTK